MRIFRQSNMKKAVALLAVFSIAAQSFIVSYADGEKKIIANTPTIDAGDVTIDGKISSGEQGDIILKVSQSNNKIYETNKLTDKDGNFKFEFEIPQKTQAEEYEYLLSENIGENTVTELCSDDFSGAEQSYTTKGVINNEIGNESPSVYLAANQRQLKQLSQSPSGEIDIYGDFYITSKEKNTNLLTTTAKQGDVNGVDTTVNKIGMSNAFEVNTNGENIVLVYADNATEQKQKITSVLQSSYELNTWYNIHIKINTETLELKSYVNNAEVLVDENKYIFKQLSYERIFDTKRVVVPVYVDNLKVTKTTPYEKLDLKSASGTFTVPAKEMNNTPDTPTTDNTYVINVNEEYAADNVLTVGGYVEPKGTLPLVLTVKDNNKVVATTEGKADENGKFKLTAALPAEKSDKTYTYVLSQKPTEADYTKIYENTAFSTSESYVVKTFEVDNTIGNDAPSAKITGGKRLLKAIDEMNTTTGIFAGEVEFMQTTVGNFDLLWSMSDNTGNLILFRVSLSNGNVNLSNQYAKGKWNDRAVLSGYEANRWYKLKAVVNLDKRYFDFYVDGTCVAEKLPISETITNINRALNVQSGSGTVYIDNARFYKDNAKYYDVEDVTGTLTNAGSDTISNALSEIASASANTVYSVLERYKNALNIDLTPYTQVSNKSYINNQIAGKTFANVSELRSAYNGAVAFAIIKESTASNIIANIKNNLLMLDMTADETVLETSEFKDKLVNNISTVSTTDELKTLIKNSEVFAALKTSTQYKVKNVINTYKKELIAFGLTNDFFELKDTPAANAAKAVFDNKDEGNDVEQLLKNIVSRLNTATEQAKKPTIGGTGNVGSTISSPTTGIPNTSAQTNAKPIENSTGMFDDLQTSHWAYNAVMSLVRKNIMVGTADTVFEPNLNTTREQFVKIITTALGIEEAQDELSFNDVDRNAWYYGYLSSAVNNGLIYGLSDEIFGVGENITRQDAAVILYRAKEKFGLDTNKEADKFADDDKIGDYAKEAVYFLKNCGALSGNENNEFMPDKSLSRAEAAMLIYQIISATNNSKDDDETEIVSATEQSKAQKLLTALDIPTSFDGEYLTKGEWAKMLAAALKLDGGADKNYFADVDDSEYKDAINALASKNIIPQSDNYEPNTVITYEQATQNVVYALGWGIDGNYKKTAGQLGLNDYIDLNYKSSLDEKSASQLIFNMLNANYLYDKNADSITSDDEHTLLGSYYKVVKVKGKVTATEDVALPNYISDCGEGQIRIDNELVYVGDTDIDLYLGYRLEAYAREENGEYTVLAYSLLSDNSVLTIDIADVDTVKGFDVSDDYDDKVNPTIKYYKKSTTKTAKLSRNTTIIYNNVITYAIENSDFIGDSGSIVLTDTDNDNKYDMVSVKKYKTYIVAGYDSTSGTVSFKDSKFILDINLIGKVALYKGDRTIEANAIAENDVLCLYGEKVDESEINNSSKAAIYISSETVTGKVTALKSGTREATVNENTYKVSPSAMNQVTSGKNQKLYLDINGIIVKAEDIADDFDYIYVLSLFKNEGNNGGSVKYISKTNQRLEAPFAKKVTYTGKNESGEWVERKSYKSEKLYELLNTVITGHTLVKVKLVDDEITNFVMAEDKTVSNDYCGYTEGAFTLDGTSTAAVSNNNVLTSNYGAVSGTTLLMLDYEDNEEDTNFAYYEKADYNSLSHLFRFVKEMYIYDANSSLNAGVCVIKLDKTLDKEVTAWSANANNVVIVDSIVEIVNDDNEPAYRIEGWCGGQTAAYETVDQNVGKMFKTYWSGNTSKDKVSELEFGDIIRVDTNASNKVYTIDVLACVDDIKDTTVVYGGNEYEWLRTYYGPVWKNYDNKILRMVGQEGQMLPVTGTIYLCDLASKEISVVGAGVYINDSDTSSPDNVFIRKKKGTVHEIVVFRK